MIVASQFDTEVYSIARVRYDDLKNLLKHMTEKGLSSEEKQKGIYFVENLEEIKAILDNN